MKTIKITNEYTIYQRRDGRYAVEAKKGGYINGDDKVAILRDNNLIKVVIPTPTSEESESEGIEESVEVKPTEEPSEPVAEAD